MKAIETIQTENKTLAVLIETLPNDDTKAVVSYFIDGIELTEWSRIPPRFQRLLAALAENLCEGMGVIKWSY
jgi:hypothetical protein